MGSQMSVFCNTMDYDFCIFETIPFWNSHENSEKTNRNDDLFINHHLNYVDMDTKISSDCYESTCISNESKNKMRDIMNISHDNFAKMLKMTSSTFRESLKNIDIVDIFLLVPIEKRNKCECCDIQRVLTEINNIHKNMKQNNKCFCKICSSFILYDPHCVCGIYDD